MLELQLKSPSRSCAVTSRDFAPGDAVVSLLQRGEKEYERVDILAEHADEYQNVTPPLCRWKWTVRNPENSEAAAARAALAQSGELFLALCGAGSDEESPDVLEEPAVSEGEKEGSAGGSHQMDAERDVLRYLLALQLQRKRQLKPVSGKRHRFIHVPSGREVEVPPVQLTPEILRRVAPQLSV